jgi:predicted esterase
VRKLLDRSVKVAIALVALLAVDSLVACTVEPADTIQRKPTKKGTTNGADPEEEEESPGTTTPGTTPTGPGTTTTDGGAGDGGGPAATPTSKGTGGPTGANTLKSAGNLSFMINAPTTPPAKAPGLLVLLHGSGASNYAQFVNMMATVATQQNLIRVSVLAPNGQGWNEGNQTNAAELLHQLVQQDLLAKYDIDLTRIVFSGQSSGGGFLSTHFLPAHAKDYRGGAFMQCGAAKPVLPLAPDAATKANFKLHFEITTGDTIWPQSYIESTNAYAAAGMSLTKDNTKTGGHCAFDQQAVIQAHIATILPP